MARAKEAFAGAGVTVVGGMARGATRRLTQASMAADGQAVLGCGIRATRTWTRLQDLLLGRGDLRAEFHAQPSVGRLRPRLQAAWRESVIVVESEQAGDGDRARAQEQRRLRYAVKWTVASDQAKGPQLLLERGAKAVAGPQDAEAVRLELVDHLGRMRRLGQAQAGQQTLFDE